MPQQADTTQEAGKDSLQLEVWQWKNRHQRGHVCTSDVGSTTNRMFPTYIYAMITITLAPLETKMPTPTQMS